MKPMRAGAPGAQRTCPHCRQTILESAGICPACRHHLRFVPGEEERPSAAASPLRVEGKIRHPPDGDPWEYSIVVTVLDEAGVVIARHMAGVGVLTALQERSFTLAVELFAP